MNLSGWGGWDEKGQSLSWDALKDDLDLIGSVESLFGVDWWDLKSIEVGQSLPSIGLALGGDESNDLFTWDTGGKGGSIYLVVACLDEIGCLCQEEEVDLCPSGVSPVGSDDEGENGIAIGVDGFDGEEEIIGGVLCFEMVDTWVVLLLPIATSGEQSKGVMRVWL